MQLIFTSKFDWAGETHAIITVLELPPKESYKILVNFESLYGMCLDFLSLVRAWITLPRAKRPILIFIPSLRVDPIVF